MNYCSKCVLPDTRPGINFNEDGAGSIRIVVQGAAIVFRYLHHLPE